VDAFSANLLFALVLQIALVVMIVWSNSYELKLRGRARRAWRVALGQDVRSAAPADRRSGIARLRDRDWYQRLNIFFKWRLAPTVAGWALILGALLLFASVTSLIAIFPLAERRDALCRDRAAYKVIGVDEAAAGFDMDIAAPCSSARRSLMAGEIYSIRLTVLQNSVQRPDQPEGWSEEYVPASPEVGHGADLPWWTDIAAVPFRRVTLAGWLQPIVEVQETHGSWLPERLFGRDVQIERPPFVCDARSGGYVTTFQPELTGTLRMFVNDTMLPGALARFYANNRGRAAVQVWTGADAPPPISGERRPLPCSPTIP
jgi:hypothetical protein